MASIRQLPSGSYQVQIRRGKHYRSETFRTEQEAHDWAADEEGRIVKTLIDARVKRGKERSFADVATEYFLSPRHAGKAATTRKREEVCSKPVLEFLGRRAIAAIEPADIQDYIDWRRRAKGVGGGALAGDTVRLDRAFMSAVFRFAMSKSYTRTNPTRSSLDMPARHEPEERISIEQRVRLESAARRLFDSGRANESMLPWLVLCLTTGMRPGEAAKVQTAWVSLDKREIRIPAAEHKPRHPRIVLLADDHCLDLLASQMVLAEAAGSDFLFFSRSRKTGEPVAYRYAHAFALLRKQAGLPKSMKPHTMRHEWISTLYEETQLSDGQIATLAGDRNVLSLERYRHLRANALRGTVDELTRLVREQRQSQLRIEASKLSRTMQTLTGQPLPADWIANPPDPTSVAE